MVNYIKLVLWHAARVIHNRIDRGSFASNFEQIANRLCAQVNSAS